MDHPVVALDVGRADRDAIDLQHPVLDSELNRLPVESLGASRVQCITGRDLPGDGMIAQDRFQLIPALLFEQFFEGVFWESFEGGVGRSEDREGTFAGEHPIQASGTESIT